MTCEPINECVELRDPCHGGHCIDADDGYVCECAVGRGGPTCAEYRESRLAHVDITFAALAIIVSCVLLLLCKCSSTVKRWWCYSSLWKAHLRATERHLPYGITFLPVLPTQVNAPRLNPSQIGRYSIYPSRRDRRLRYLGVWLHTEMVCLRAGSNPSKY